ncbi:MAG: 4Fe-4S binding protein [candidate division WOR-3 bacterium]|jgi:pyruvate ferredoxin oxidoreductase delta subunit|nr:4Fe-4S binding protein [candidate division WOR-3 bacterium]MDH7518995.1 4Fe-4S binding protein [bacterium]
MAKLKGWRELPCGAIITDMAAVKENKTGAWRSKRPVWDKEKCKQCLMCWIYCPDSSIMVKEGKVIGINYEYCKGCGNCASICPAKAITMEKERK